jgi:hypothetical protein
MWAKGKIMEFVIRHELIPARVRWRRSASGVGRLFKDIFRASIGAYDSGLIEGINKNIEHSVTCRRSMGAKVCELILRRRN